MWVSLQAMKMTTFFLYSFIIKVPVAADSRVDQKNCSETQILDKPMATVGSAVFIYYCSSRGMWWL